MLFVVANNAFSQKLHLCFKSTDSAYAEDPIQLSFNEIKNGKTTGKYFLSLKGPKVMYFYYYDKQRKSRINFAQDYSSENQCSCEW